MEIHIIQVGQLGLTSLRKCIPEQQKGDKHLVAVPALIISWGEQSETLLILVART